MQLNPLGLCIRSGKVVHSMVAHLDAVTCLTTDPKGTYLISGSKQYSAVWHVCTLESSFKHLSVRHVWDFLFPLCPLQAMIAQCACGCWTTGHACRRSQLIGRSTTRPFTTWRSTRPSPSSPVLAQMHLPRSLSDTAPIILVITLNPHKDMHVHISVKAELYVGCSRLFKTCTLRILAFFIFKIFPKQSNFMKVQCYMY